MVSQDTPTSPTRSQLSTGAAPFTMNEIEEAPAQGIHDDKILGPDASDPLSTLDSKDVATEGIYGVKQTYRHLKPRQVQMLALSGSIGTGLYVSYCRDLFCREIPLMAFRSGWAHRWRQLDLRAYYSLISVSRFCFGGP